MCCCASRRNGKEGDAKTHRKLAGCMIAGVGVVHRLLGRVAGNADGVGQLSRHTIACTWGLSRSVAISKQPWQTWPEAEVRQRCICRTGSSRRTSFDLKVTWLTRSLS